MMVITDNDNHETIWSQVCRSSNATVFFTFIHFVITTESLHSIELYLNCVSSRMYINCVKNGKPFQSKHKKKTAI